MKRTTWQLAVVYYQLSKRLKLGAIVNYLEQHSFGRCVDIGTGTGGLAFLFRKYGRHWSYVEVDPLVVRQAETLLGEGNVVRSLDDLKGEKFELITMIDSVYYFDRPNELIDRLGEFLQPEGQLLITATDGDPTRMINRLRERIHLGKAARGFAFEESPDEFLRRFRQKNWRVIYFKRFSFIAAELLMILYDRLQSASGRRGADEKETSVLTNRAEVDRRKIWLLKLSFPALYCLALLDWPIRPFLKGYKFIVVAKPPIPAENGV
jgi:SAM-dependent methyltransferase